MKRIICIFGILLSAFPLFGQATTGYHRVNQVIARSNSGTTALVVPFAQISVTNTATGAAATIFFDPLLSSPIPSSLVTADLSGNYNYYMPLNTCNTEVISAPGQSNIVIPNICGNPASSVTLQTNGSNNQTQSLLNLVAGEGIVLENVGGAVTINSEAAGGGVVSINNVGGAFTFAGSGVSCTSTTCIFSNSGVTSINAASFSPLTGAVQIACGTGLSCTQSGSTISISVGTPFTINSFTGCGGSFELGFSLTNPTCSATYSATPTSASITNTEGIDSPLTLFTPFTSGTILGTFVHSTITTTTVTLTAVGSSTQTANQTMTWNPRIFGGVGSSGATASITASGTTAVLSTGDVLSSLQLGTETSGSSCPPASCFGPFSTSGQNIYLLLIGGSHTFADNSTGFAFPFNTPIPVTFVNANGTSVSMFLYQSTNPLFGPWTIRVAS